MISNGNVALDVARIFSKKAEAIKSTDISQRAFDRIKNNNIENVMNINKIFVFIVFSLSIFHLFIYTRSS